ncbi:MAG TPA: CAP domain-containing protein [Conexibacter sp.]|nr:CAP domain-containing protein [Conexibacter sp.]
MMASQLPLSRTTSPRLDRSALGLLAAVVLLALPCLETTAQAAPPDRASRAQGTFVDATATLSAPVRAPGVRGHVAPAPSARAALRGCAPARGVLRARRSMLRTRRRLLCLMNRARARFGLRPLSVNRCLHRVASRHAHDMVRRRYFAHVTPNGWDPGRRARHSGYAPRSARWAVGENIAWGVAAAARPAWVVRSWMKSPSHRHNLLSRRFRDAGIGVARGTPYRGFRAWRLRATFSVEFGVRGGRTHCARRR